MVQNWNCDGSSKVFSEIRCRCAWCVMLTTKYLGIDDVPTSLHISDCFKPPTVVGVNILSDLLEG